MSIASRIVTQAIGIPNISQLAGLLLVMGQESDTVLSASPIREFESGDMPLVAADAGKITAGGTSTRWPHGV